MNKLRRLLRAEYWWQPGQLPRRAWRVAHGVNRRPQALIRLPWGFPIGVDPRESIGRSIVALNMLDLPVTETIWRLLDPGERCADIGANIGFMVSVMAARLRSGGAITAYEPLPELADALRANVHSWRNLTRATIDLQQVAVGARRGSAQLFIPATFAENRGQASLVNPNALSPGTRNIDVETVRLDDVFANDPTLALLKIDVEGFESAVLEGAENLLRTGRVRDIVMEEYGSADAASLRLLRAHGYEIFRVTRGCFGPRLSQGDSSDGMELDPPTYLATRDGARARMRFAPCGWQALRGTRA